MVNGAILQTSLSTSPQKITHRRLSAKGDHPLQKAWIRAGSHAATASPGNHAGGGAALQELQSDQDEVVGT